jgi:hypothetical protein
LVIAQDKQFPPGGLFPLLKVLEHVDRCVEALVHGPIGEKSTLAPVQQLGLAFQHCTDPERQDAGRNLADLAEKANRSHGAGVANLRH